MAVSQLFLLLSLLLFASPLLSSSSSIFPTYARPTKSGYLPIDDASSRSLFYAFYEAQEPLWPLSDTPLLLWLEGGPGGSSLLGNYFHFGPWLISPEDNLTLYRNPYTWNRHFGLLFIDSPLGTGYSIVDSTAEIPRDQFTIASHLYVALQTFLSSSSSFRSRAFYITGESYSGKFVPSLGCHILRQNKHDPSNLQINLKGVAIGNGLTHPIVQVTTHADAAYFIGLINAEQKMYLESLQSEVVNLIAAQKWKEANDLREVVLGMLQNDTGLATLFDFTKETDYPIEMISEFLDMDEVKAAFGVSKEVHFQLLNNDVVAALAEDLVQSAKYMVEDLVRNIRVLLYQGVYDLDDGVYSTELWLREMHWEYLEEYLKAKRKVWKDDGLLVGHVQRFASLTEVVLYGAGHFAVHDQKHNAQKMIEQWIMEKGHFHNEDADHGIQDKLTCPGTESISQYDMNQ